MIRQTRGWKRAVGAGVLCGGGLLAGCAQQQLRQLTSESFLPPREVNDRSHVQPVDQPGQVVYEGPGPEKPRHAAPAEDPDSMASVSPTVEQSVRPVREEGFQVPDASSAEPKSDDGTPPEVAEATRAAPATSPESTPAPTSSPAGGYQLVGTVLADVNSSPIFADRVLAVLDKALAADAKKLDERQFANKAAELILKQVHEYVATELEFAMARSRLEARDQQLASAAATKWREDQITKAGGSPEVAKQQWAARGLDFEEQVEEQYRTYMVQLYYQRKELPKVQVTAEDKRRYYQENLSREFSQAEAAKFRVIMVDPRKRGSRQAAVGEINRLLDRARSGGTSFEDLANGDANDNPSFRQPAGWIARGAFVVPEVEQAAWSLKPGQISDVIETPAAFYLVKLDEVQAGKVLAFTDPGVQRQIEKTLTDQQFRVLRSRAQQRLIRDAIIRYHPDEEGMLRTAVDMALQKYRYWRTS